MICISFHSYSISKFMIFISNSVVFHRLIFALIRTYENSISALMANALARTCTYRKSVSASNSASKLNPE